MTTSSKIIFLTNWVQQTSGDVVVTMYILQYTSKLERAKPELKTKIWFTHDKDKLRPFRFEKFTGNISTYISEKEAIKILKSAKLIIISPKDPPPNIGEFLEFVKTFQIPKPRMITICPMCLQDYQRVTVIRKGSEYSFYGNTICRRCALKEIREDYTKRGIEITKSTREFYNKQLEHSRSVERTVSILETESPYRDEDSINTLYDVIPADTEYRTAPIDDFMRTHKRHGSLHPDLVKHFIQIGIRDLLPVQQIAIKHGLLKYRDLLVVAGTSSGKTFVGELAGLHVLKNRNAKFVFLTPLVALTNQKYELFKKRYRPLGMRVGIRVGVSKIEVDGEERVIVDSNIKSSDIVVGTYEAFDWIIRSGKASELGSLGVLVIDEVQLLGDDERGQQLDGLIARIRLLFPKCQIICLSATVGNANELAAHLKLELVSYEKRPVPLERHLVLTEKIEEKEKRISKLIHADRRQKSSHGYPGKSIVFTNSRRRAQNLAAIFRADKLRAAYYHAGLTYADRKKIELGFEKGYYDVITTTAALGAGVDFPVSQVIFEVPGMGARWLKVSEFHQMIGRAGRFGYHDIGRAYLFVTPGEKIYASMDRSEEQVGFELLTGDVEDVDVEIDFDQEADQVLAVISALNPISITKIKDYYSNLYYSTQQLSTILGTLSKLKMTAKRGESYYVTALGRATASSFLTPHLGYRIASETLKRDVLDVAVELSPFESIHLSQAAHAEIEHVTKTRMSTKLFSDGVLDVIFGNNENRGTYTRSLAEKIKLWTSLFFRCNCKESPYCDHPKFSVSKKIVEMRLSGYSPKQISLALTKEYHLFAYPGDLYSWLDSLIHSIEAIRRLANAMKREEIVKSSKTLIVDIQKGKRIKRRKKSKKKQLTKKT